MMRIHIDSKLIEDGYVNKIKHPTDDLYIYNYTAKAQYENKWLEYPEIRLCRGLVLNSDNFIVARPFEKFHNIEEHSEKSIVGALPNYRSFEVYDKLDGSLGISYVHSGGVGIATRGSFSSDQAIWATQFLKTNHTLFTQDHPEDLTFLFEIIYKQNKIVVDYDFKGLVLLSIMRKDGSELQRPLIEKYAERYKFKVVEKFDFLEDFSDIRNIVKRENAEGFVVKFDNGLRVKLKYNEYVRLHKIVTGVNTKTIWEMLKEDKDFGEILNLVPDEFYNWVKIQKETISQNFEKIMLASHGKKSQIANLSRKEQAEVILRECPEISGVIFSLLDENTAKAKEISWKLVKPKTEKPYREE